MFDFVKPVLLFNLDADTLVYGVLIIFILIGILAFRRNYIIQIKLSLLMDTESSVYNKDGLRIYLNKTKGLKPSLISVNINNLGQLYSSYKEKSNLMYNIATLICKDMERSDTIARVDFNKFILVINSKANIKDIILQIEDRFRTFDIKNYGKFNFHIDFGVYENIDMKKADVCAWVTPLIPMFSLNRDNNIYYYSEAVLAKASKVETINQSKQHALTGNQFSFTITPRVSFIEGKVVGGQLNTKWLNENQQEMFSSDEYLPIFEETGFIAEFDAYVFEKACELLRSLSGRNAFISLQFSKQSFSNVNFIDNINTILQRYGVNPGLLKIIITESSFSDLEITVKNAIHRLKVLGLKVSVGNFGRENAAIITILENSLDTVVIDKFFFGSTINQEREKEILTNIISMLEKTKCEIVCDGIDSKQTLDILATISTNLVIQGSYISQPLLLSAFPDFLNSRTFSFEYEKVIPSQKGSIPVRTEHIQQVDPSIEALKRELNAMKSNQTPNINVMPGGNSNNAELLLLMRQIEELKQLTNNNANVSRDRGGRDYEIDLLKMQIEQLKNNNSNHQQQPVYKSEAERELEQLKKELYEVKNSVNKAPVVDERYKKLEEENERLRRLEETERIRREETERIRREEAERIRREEQERLLRELRKEEAEKKLLNDELEAKKKSSELERLKLEEEKLKELEKLRLEEERLKELERLKLENERKKLEESKVRQSEEEILRKKLQEYEDQRKKDELERKRVEEELEKARLEKEELEGLMGELLQLKDIGDDEEEVETEDYDEEEDDEEEEEVTEVRQIMALPVIEAIVASLKDKYNDKWEQRASEDLKDTYEDFLYSLNYYRQKLRKTVSDKVLMSGRELQVMYNSVKNEIMKYNGVTNKVTSKYDMFYIGKNQIVKLSVTKTKVRAYMDLDPDKYPVAQFPHKDVSSKKAHMKTPYLTMLKSPLSFKRFTSLLSEIMIHYEVNENLKYKKFNYVKDLHNYKTQNIIF